MTKTTIAFLMASLTASVSFAMPKYGPNAVPLSARSNIEYFKKRPAYDYWALSPYYLPQETPRGCSAANIAMILNAARVGMKLESADELITFKSFTEKYANDEYRDAILGKSLTTGTNFSNQNLAHLVDQALDKLKIRTKNSRVEQVIIDQNNLKAGKQRFLDDLKKNERSANDFIFFSFIQGGVTGDPEGGAHVGTVAAYDEAKQLVLVMDPDRQYYEPYWTPAEKLFDAIKDPKSDSRKEAGWIYLQAK